MFKTFSKLLSILFLLVLSFVYTDKVFSEAKKSDPVMKEIVKYKEKNKVKPIEPIIKDDEIILGISGLEVNEDRSYKNMKDENIFNKDKLEYDKILPNTSIENSFDYYIKKGNNKNKYVYLIFKIDSNDNLDDLLSLIAKNNIIVNFFVDGKFMEENIDTGFAINNLNSEIYNLGYDGKYEKDTIGITNNLIESITLKESLYCLNENKNEDYKKVCDKKRMYSVIPSINNPSISKLKESLENGSIISYNLNTFDINEFNTIINSISKKGYELKGLSELIVE